MWMFLAVAVAADELPASPVFTPYLQLRPRVEWNTGKDAAPGGEVGFVTQRARAGGTLALDALEIEAVLQDVRVWGTEQDTLGDFSADGFDLHVGRLVVSPTDRLRVSIGRQPFALHEHRLIGTVNWTSQGRSFDGGRLDFSGERWGFEVAGAVLASPLRADNPDTAGMAYLAGGLRDSARVDAVLVSLFDPNTDRMLQTFGGYASSAPAVLSGRAEAYAQLGRSGGNPHRAGMFGVRGTLAPEASGKPSITAWYDYLTGDARPADGTSSAFDTLFATNHKFYGLMDILLLGGLGGNADGQGLQDAALKLQMTPVEGVTTKLDGHLFVAASDGRVIGEEVDAVMGWAATPGLVLSAGGGVLSRPDTEALDGWAFLMLDAVLP